MTEKKTTTTKKTTEKKVEKPVRKAVVKKETKAAEETKVKAKTVVVEQTVPVVAEKKAKKDALHVEVWDMAGKVAGTVALPAEIFAAKINPALMAQAVRVYLANQRRGTVSTKTRGEVAGSTRKIYRQKGTGRARHGGLRAPIFVKGGIAHGPKPVDHSLSLSKNMKRAALLSALSAKVKANEIRLIDGLQNIETKTKVVADALRNMNMTNKTLLVVQEHNEKIYKSARNIKGVSVTSANQLNTYQVLEHKSLVFMKEAIEAVEKMFGKEKK